MSGITYKDAGVDLARYEDAMKRLPKLMHRTFSPRVIRHDGGFAGLFRLDFPTQLFARNYVEPVLVSGTDGVGTKLKLAQQLQKYSTIGIDLVAMCANDVICCGAEPLFFLDYIAMDKDDPQKLEQLVTGISQGCLLGDCALLGGETAIMPDVYQPDDFDMAGFCVGVVERKNLIDGRNIAEEDVLIGVGSNGVHANGFSLVRKIVFDRLKLGVNDPVPELGTTVGEALLRPTQIYVEAVRRVLGHYKIKQVVHGIAHITGGGLEENVGRILPPGIQVNIDTNAWEIPPVFRWLQQAGGVDSAEMFRVFNMGIGLVLIVSPYYAEPIRRTLSQIGLANWIIGDVSTGAADSPTDMPGPSPVLLQNRA